MASPTALSRRHHYIPRFYLKAWQASDGSGLWLYRRDKKGNIRHYRRWPKSVGYATDLYSLQPETPHLIPGPSPDVIERDFFAVIDDAAALVYQKLFLSGIKSLTTEDRMAWALFLNSLMERRPERIAEIEHLETGEKIKNELHQRLGGAEYLNNINWSSMYRNSVRRALIGYISDRGFIDCVTQMRWATVDVSIDGEHLITADRPVLVNAGSSPSPIHCLSIALSPKRLLIVHGQAEEFDENFVRTLTAIHNVAIVQQATKYVVSSQEMKNGPHTQFSRVIQECFK